MLHLANDMRFALQLADEDGHTVKFIQYDKWNAICLVINRNGFVISAEPFRIPATGMDAEAFAAVDWLGLLRLTDAFIRGEAVVTKVTDAGDAEGEGEGEGDPPGWRASFRDSFAKAYAERLANTGKAPGEVAADLALLALTGRAEDASPSR